MELEREAHHLALDCLRDEAVRRLVQYADGELTVQTASEMIDRWIQFQQPAVDEAYEHYLDEIKDEEK